MTFRTTKRTDADLIAIARFSLERFGKDVAERYVTALDAMFHRIAASPRQLGTHYARSYWRCYCGSHVIYYRIVGNGIVVSRVLHRRQLPERNL